MLLNNQYSGICSNCNRPTLLDPIGYCGNQFNKVNICNFIIPNDNGRFRRKMKEHTSLWSGRNVSSHSWVAGTGLYTECTQSVLLYGSLFYDIAEQQPYLIFTPSGDCCFAQVIDTSTGIVTGASGILQPLNQKLSILHPHFGNFDPRYLFIATPPLVIEIPDRNASHEVIAYKDNDRIFSYDLNSKVYIIH